MELPPKAVTRIVEDFAQTALGDPRRTERVCSVVAKMARSPSSSLPTQLGSDAELQGAYRAMNNDAVTFAALHGAHAEGTKRRAEFAKRVLVLHDTTECCFPNLDPEEVGFLSTGKPGFLLHVSLAVDGSTWKRPLGVIHAETISRAKKRKTKPSRKPSGTETAKWSQRESLRWWRGMNTSDKLLSNCERVIHVADREGDSYELMANLLAAEQRFVIRVRVDRRARASAGEQSDWSTVQRVANACEGLLDREVPLTRRAAKPAPTMKKRSPERKARMAKLRFAATKIEIPRPQYLHDPVPEELSLNLVHVRELDAPIGEPVVEWLLYTTEPIGTADEVAAVVDDYRARWTIEEFNAALKTGCAYESRRFESLHALLNMLALSMPIACEVLWLRSRARTVANAPATEVLSARQLLVLAAMGSRKLPPAPTVHDALWAVAGMGGHLKRNGEPGWVVLQRGMTSLLAYEAGWAAAERSHRRGNDL